MPKYLFFDLETTSKYWTHAKILQISYFLLDDSFEVLEVFNQYLLPDEEVPPSATAVNHLTRNKLQFLSKGVVLEDIAPKLFEVFNDPDTIICGHNSDVYDIPILQRELDNAGVDHLEIPADRRLDTLPIMRQKLVGATSRTLSAATSYVLSKFGIKQSDINEMFTSITGETEFGYHGALYDAFMTMSIYLLTKDMQTV